MTDTNAVPIPRYKCHKEVSALKIKQVLLDSDRVKGTNTETDGTALLTPEESSTYAPFSVDADFVHKHKPFAGGYYVVYADGYKSFSPAEAFESGYTRMQ